MPSPPLAPAQVQWRPLVGGRGKEVIFLLVTAQQPGGCGCGVSSPVGDANWHPGSSQAGQEGRSALCWLTLAGCSCLICWEMVLCSLPLSENAAGLSAQRLMTKPVLSLEPPDRHCGSLGSGELRRGGEAIKNSVCRRAEILLLLWGLARKHSGMGKYFLLVFYRLINLLCLLCPQR